MQMLMDTQEALQPEDADGVMAFRKARVGTRMIYCRPERVAFPSNSDVARGTAKGVAQWKAHDPRIYSIYEQITTITLGPGVLSGSANVYMGGNWKRDGVPSRRVEVNGPGTNVRVANSNHDNRTFKLNGTLASNQTILLNTWDLTVWDQGADVSATGLLSRDSRWWQLQRGENTITVNRDSPGSGTLVVKVYHRDAYTL
jgi:hypothetical protein